MIIERTITTQLDILDTKVIWADDLNSELLKILHDQYVGKCYLRCFVIRIVEIVKRNSPIVEQMRNSGSTRIPIIFKVEGIIYDINEIIPDAKIIKILEDGNIILENKYAKIMMQYDPKLQHFKKNDIIPVRVVGSEYIAYRSSCSVIATAFIPYVGDVSPREITFTKSDMENVDVISLLEKLENAHKRLSLQKYKQWVELLDPDEQKFVGYKYVDIISITGSGHIIKPNWSNTMDKKVWFAEDTKIEKKHCVHVLRGYLNQMLKQVELAISICENYNWDSAKNSAWVNLYKSSK